MLEYRLADMVLLICLNGTLFEGAEASAIDVVSDEIVVENFPLSMTLKKV